MIRRMILNYILKYLFKTSIDNELQKIERSPENASLALQLQDNGLLDQICKSIQYDAQNQMYNQCSHVQDIVFPKAMLYTISKIQEKIRVLANPLPDQSRVRKKW